MTPGRAALLLVAFSSLLHLLAAGGGAGLSGDEAHYALYGYHLDWSYFDHPPLVGWLQALVLLFSSGEFALRLWPVLLGALASLALFRLTRELYPEASPWTAFAAVALLHSALAFQVLSLAMLPDSPLLPLGLAAALFLHRALARGEACDWLVLGALFGLAGLAKYTAVTLALSAVLLLALVLHSELFAPWLPFAENQYPFGDLYGWEQAVQRAEEVREAMAQEPGPAPVLFAGNWSYASHLAWPARPRPVQVADERYDQNDLWFGTPQAGARGVLVVPWQFRNDAARWQQRFEQCAQADVVSVVLRGTVAVSYTLYRCAGYRG